MRVFILILLALPSCLSAQSAAGASGTFKITQTNPVISTSTISGKENYRITATAEGFEISSNIWVAEGETPVLSQVEESLGPDWILKRYVFDGLVGGIKQKFEAWIDGGKVHMQVTSERMNPRRSVDLAANVLVLDNFVPTHFQVLLNQFAHASAQTPSLNAMDACLIVPQRLLAIKARFTRDGSGTGVLDGKEIELDKYMLQGPGVKAEVWASKQGRLLGVYFEQPDIEYLQDHFDLPHLRLAKKKTLPSERPVGFRSHGRQLLGALMLPPESLGIQEKYPVVVMVAGFGPMDRDETVGRSKPLRDIAVGLANKGIASLRYDKPTYTFRGKMDPAKITVEEETIDAAAAAAAFAATAPEVDPSNIFLLGHSEGGALAAFILEQAQAVKGAILLAAPGRPPEEFIPEQLAAGLKMHGVPEGEIVPQVRAARQQLSAIRQGRESPSNVLGMAGGFWRSLMARDPLTALRTIKVPLLVLQGDRDAQLNQKDFHLLTAAIPPGKLESEYFNGLNHIFAPAPEGSVGSEILIGTHVASQVIDRIGSWIEKQRTHTAVDVAGR